MEGDMSEYPLVTVIVPIYNKQKLLSKCLDSLLAQTYHNVEIIIVDDCSTDKSAAKAKFILRQCTTQKVRIIQNESNIGHIKSRYKGIDKAQGEYVMFIDADDWIEPAAIQELVDAMLRYDVDLVQMRNQRRLRSVAVKYKESFDPLLADRRIEGEEFRTLASYIGMDSYIFPACWGKLYKTDKLKEMTRMEFNQFWGEDQIFNIQYLRECRSMAFSNYVGYNYRWGGETSRYKYSALKEYKQVHHLKRIMGQDEQCINDEIKTLLRYHIRSLITELGFTREVLEMILETELRDPLWAQVGLNTDVADLLNEEYTDIQHNKMRYFVKRLLK